MRLIIAALFIGSVFGQGGFNGLGSYEIRNIKSGKVLDLDRNDQTTVIQYSSGGSDNQTWFFQDAGPGWYYIRNGMNGNALTATQNRNAAPVQGLPYDGAPNQQWTIEPGKDGNALIVSRDGKSLDIPDGTDRDGVHVQIFDRNGDSNQRFTLRQVAGGYAGRGNRPGWMGPDQGSITTCSSDDGRRHYCDADTRGTVQMTRQISGSPCTQGQTWGYDNRGIWVDRGCRAEFQVSQGYNGNSGNRRARDRGGDNYNNNAGVQIVTCSSDDGRRHTCRADTRGGVQLTRQISGTACTQGQTWGYDNNEIWVDRGCRAEFQTGVVIKRAKRWP